MKAAMHRLRIGPVRLTVWPRSLPWLLEVGRRQWWLFDSGKRRERAGAGTEETERMDDMNVTSQGPNKPPPDRDALERKRRAALWSAVWEASQSLTDDEITDVVVATLREIESDKP
jgi:hypothetical protein